MKKTLTVLIVGVCLLGTTQLGKSRTYSLDATQLSAFADYFGTSHPVLTLDSAGPNDGNAFTNTRESVRVFPEPATMMLFGLGLLGLASFRRRFK